VFFEQVQARRLELNLKLSVLPSAGHLNIIELHESVSETLQQFLHKSEQQVTPRASA